MKCEQTLERIVCIHKHMPLPVILLFIFATPPKRHGIAMGGVAKMKSNITGNGMCLWMQTMRPKCRP